MGGVPRSFCVVLDDVVLGADRHSTPRARLRLRRLAAVGRCLGWRSPW